MTDATAIQKMQRQSELENERSNWDSHWTEVAERILPRSNNFNQKTSGGEKRTEKIFDSTAVLALDRAASAIDSLLTPDTQQWHSLEPEDEALRENHEVMVYLGEVTKQLFRVRYRPAANFGSQKHECYINLMAFGTQGMFTDDVPGVGIRYKSIPLSELYIAENHVGMVDYIHRKFELTARAALQKWQTGLPPEILKAAEVSPFRMFEFIHCVHPNEEYDHSRHDYRGMEWASYYISKEGTRTMSRGGYRAMPYSISRHVTASRETYGRSPAMQVLPDIKMVNEMEKTVMRAAHKVVDPPLLVYGDGILSAFSTRPNAINYGGVNDQGQQLVVPLKSGANLPIVLEMTEQKRKLINDAFYVTLFQILVQNPQMTATEALIRAQEKGQLLAPTVSRQQTEFLGPTIQRELDILAAAGALPPMPEALAMAGAGVKITYTNPLARLRRAEDGIAIMRTIESLQPISQVKPDAFDIFDMDELPRELAEINGVPPKVLKSRERMAKEAEQKAQAQQVQTMQQQADVADTASSAAKNLGQAAQAAGFSAPAVSSPLQ